MTPGDLWYLWAGVFVLLLVVLWACAVVSAAIQKTRAELARLDGERQRQRLNDVMGRRVG